MGFGIRGEAGRGRSKSKIWCTEEEVDGGGSCFGIWCRGEGVVGAVFGAHTD